MTASEKKAAETRLVILKKRPTETGCTSKGLNVGENLAAQAVVHAPRHLIPRRAEDMDNPKDGVRAVIAERQKS